MAGALIGATITDIPEAPIVDRHYIEHEADRMWAIGEGRRVPNFPYPSLMTWAPPRSQTDAVGTVEDGLAVAGLGPITSREEVVAESGKNDSGWGWVGVWFGQRLLIKQRARPTPLQQSQRVSATTHYRTASLLDGPASEQDLHAGANSRLPEGASNIRQTPPRTLHRITDEVISAGFEPDVLGRALLELAEREDGIELAAQFAAIIAKARLTRLDRDRKR
jgi:hypothetical protein